MLLSLSSKCFGKPKISVEAGANLADESTANTTIHNSDGFDYYCANGRNSEYNNNIMKSVFYFTYAEIKRDSFSKGNKKRLVSIVRAFLFSSRTDLQLLR